MSFFDMIQSFDTSVLEFIQNTFKCSFLDPIMAFFSYMGVDKKHRRRCPCPCRSPALSGSVSFLLPLCKVPCRGRFRSDNHAAVLLCSDFCQ